MVTVACVALVSAAAERAGRRPGWRLIYDGACPFCHWYCRRFAGVATLVDFRAAGATGLPADCDPDRALLLDTGAAVLSGAAALRVLASSASARRLDRLLFGGETRGRALYPMLRALRNGYLRITGRRTPAAGGQSLDR